MSETQLYKQDLTPSEIVMLQIEVQELRNKVIKLEQDNFLLNEKNKQLVWSAQVQD